MMNIGRFFYVRLGKVSANERERYIHIERFFLIGWKLAPPKDHVYIETGPWSHKATQNFFINNNRACMYQVRL